MDFLVWGAGAIGGTLGAHLARAGHTVTLVDKAENHVAAINRDGMTITGPIAQFTVRLPAFTPDAFEGHGEAVLLCVKAQDTEAASRALAPHLDEDGYVVSVQNGLNELVIAEVVGRPRTIGAFVNFGADYMEPGVVMYGGRGAVVLGELDGQSTPRLEALQRSFLAFEPNAITTPNIWGYLWGKLAYGAQLFVTALTNDSIADCLADARYADVYINTAHEVLAVAAAEGVTPLGFNGFDPLAFVPGADRGVSLRSLDEMAVHNRKSAKTHSGIWRDLAVRKRRTEVDAQLGPVVAIGQQYGIATPLATEVIRQIHEIEEGRRAQCVENLDVLRAMAS